MTLTLPPASPTAAAYGILPSSPGTPNLATHQTTNKVQKLLERIALSGLSFAMPLTLLVSFAGGASAGLTGSAALTALCLSVIKALGFATIAALGTVGTFGLMCAIPVVVLGLTLLVRHLYHRKQAADAFKKAFSNAFKKALSDDIKKTTSDFRSTFENRSKREIDCKWNRHLEAMSTIVLGWMCLSPAPGYKNQLITYLNRYKRLEEPILTSAFIYLQRLHKKILLTEEGLKLIFTVCLVLAAKHHYDNIYKNSAFAEVCQASLSEINELERTILAHLEYNIEITQSEFSDATKLLDSIRFYIPITSNTIPNHSPC